jgi:hypothetical protein
MLCLMLNAMTIEELGRKSLAAKKCRRAQTGGFMQVI